MPGSQSRRPYDSPLRKSSGKISLVIRPVWLKEVTVLVVQGCIPDNTFALPRSNTRWNDPPADAWAGCGVGNLSCEQTQGSGIDSFLDSPNVRCE